MTGALWAKRGERDISRGAWHEREARDEGNRKIFLFPSYRALSRSPRLGHKAPVMQASPLKWNLQMCTLEIKKGMKKSE